MNIHRFYKIFNFLMLPFSFLYLFLLFIIKTLYRFGIIPRKKFRKKIVSVGNITVGGTGKTPFVIFLAKLFKRKDKKVVVVSRGYKRQSKDKLIVLRDNRENAEVGDEPWLISKKGIPVVISQDKRDGCTCAIDKYEPDIIILDDGFQSFSIERDIDILLLDATDNFLKSRLLPAGRLREPLGVIKRAGIIIITRCNQTSKKQIQKILKKVRKYSLNRPLFLSFHKPLLLSKIPGEKVLSPSYLKGKRILSLASIGNNQSFILTLKSLGLNIVYSMDYLDHHAYSKSDIERIKKLVDLHNIDSIVTTEKDIYSLRFYVDELNVPLYSLAIELSLEETERFEELLKAKGLI